MRDCGPQFNSCFHPTNQGTQEIRRPLLMDTLNDPQKGGMKNPEFISIDKSLVAT